jgi:hypothetical protein
MEMIMGSVIFAVLNMICELILFGLIPPRTKLRMLGNDKALVMTHLVLGGLTLYVHWGTVTGTGAAMVAFIISFPTLWIAKQVFFGYVRDGKYHRRIIGYTAAELA